MTNKDILTMLLCSYGYDRNIRITRYKEDFETTGYEVYAENGEGDVYQECNSEGIMSHIYCILKYMKDCDAQFKSNWWDVPTKHIVDDTKREYLVHTWDKADKEHKQMMEDSAPLFKWLSDNNPCINCTDNKRDHWDNVHHNCELCHNHSCPKLKEFDANYIKFRAEHVANLRKNN